MRKRTGKLWALALSAALAAATVMPESLMAGELNSTLNLPKRYDLRELGTVTGVKNQNPWTTCWAFGACAAAETSILNLIL